MINYKCYTLYKFPKHIIYIVLFIKRNVRIDYALCIDYVKRLKNHFNANTFHMRNYVTSKNPTTPYVNSMCYFY